ncbi:hemerythrin domain-containing protein [Mycolicibacterium sp. GF69]|uniref:hemerythrin domain-containing protein n=1 Tax=Mycolicibacterium sp. GF69 TaxID=2267251 RepID=UPI000DCB9C69|nr:hemerythrin domain-containing protein [Mycolicibacterium sp. GF69]RAV18224.1 hemerythrin domain-containing protein [Mycolicibacterium sp. GF69]
MHTLAPDVALEREHLEIDGAIETFVEELAGGSLRSDALSAALETLRRHIYLEECMLFPPIREAGMVMPVFVMMREHGQLWRSMDALDALLAGDADVHALYNACGQLLAQLHQHNAKEESIVYPRIETDLPAQTRVEVTRFLDAGQMPDGWVCQHARQ